MKNVLIDITVHARGEMATKLLEAAEELGLSPLVVKTTSEGFRVPEEIHAHLFPSQYAPQAQPSPPELPLDELVQLDQGAEVEDTTPDEDEDLLGEPATDAEIRAWAKANGVEVADRGALSQAVRDAYSAAR